VKSLFVLSLILVAAFATTANLEKKLLRQLFNNWQIVHDRAYKTAHEEELRFKIFSENYLSILKFNAEQDDVTLALNNFGDLSNSEFKAQYTGYKRSQGSNGAEVVVFDVQDTNSSVDWRTQGAVTPVKNQGQCGSCWAFSSTGALEGLHKIKTGTLVSLSEQNLVDCVTADQGCDGGEMSDAFDYTAQNGIQLEADYPYVATDQTCAFVKTKAVQVNTGYVNVTVQSVDQLKAAITQQPVSVAVQANQLVWQFYFGGVISKNCGDNLDHGVLAVGFGTIKGKDAFIVKNSWGASWGAQGYVYISTDGTKNNGNGVCGILMDPVYPISA